MNRFVLTTLLGIAVVAGAVRAQQDTRRGTIKSFDAAKGTVTITADGRDFVLAVTPDTRVTDASNRMSGPPFPWKGIGEGMAVLFRVADRDGRAILLGLRTGGAPLADTSGLKPLTELGKAEYKGFPGGLYPNGANERPVAHEAAGRKLASQVQPLDADGRPNATGKIVLLSVGMSNTAQVSEGFQRLLASEADRNLPLVFVNGAQGGMTAAAIQDPNDGRTGTRYWTVVDESLKAAGVTRAQVQAVWIKQADAGPTQGFPAYAKTLQAELTRIVQLLPGRFSNLKLVYLSSRTFGGFAITPLNPEPYAYESGFAVKWLIERQIQGASDLSFDPAKGPVPAPWLSWGPYFWANGTNKRADGHFFTADDFTAADGTHLSPSGQAKTGRLLLDFLKTDATARPWFVRH